MVWKIKRENNPTEPIPKYKEMEMWGKYLKKKVDEVSRSHANNRGTK